MTEQRINKLRTLLVSEKLDAILIFGLTNIRYLCGFTGTDGVLLVSPSEVIFMTDSRYVEQARNEVATTCIDCYKSKLKGVEEKLASRHFRNVGFDAAAISVAVFEELSSLVRHKINWIQIDDQLDPLRGLKEQVELDFLKAAARLNYLAFDTVFPSIEEGMTEREIALELEFSLRRLGGEEKSFDFIVASGVRGALPHGVASDKVIKSGELVTIDFGTRVAGYHSDETVTFAVGEVDGKLRQIFDIVLEAHDSALSMVQAGLAACELDAIARNYIASKGYGEYFGHSLGHGVGLDVHEYPAVSSRSGVILSEGMVITIEPGIYLPEIGGVRIEDTVVVTSNGCEVLTSIPKQFRQLD